MKRQHSGFTLVEIAMVLFIVVLLLGGLVPTITAQLEQQRTRETMNKLSEIRQALIGYALRTGTLPCPARAQTPTGQSFSGVDAGNAIIPPCSGASAWGVVPWATLGTSETDAWGRRFTYRVTPDFADSIASATYGGCTPNTTPTQASFGLCSVGNLTVKAASGGGGTIVANSIPAIIISHGKNGTGAWTPQGTQPTTTSSNNDEKDNILHSSNLEYVSHNQTPDFDDLVEWITPNILFNRMVTAGKLP
jgi:type II secretory pathway pseudopilin PulG